MCNIERGAVEILMTNIWKSLEINHKICELLCRFKIRCYFYCQSTVNHVKEYAGLDCTEFYESIYNWL